MKGMKPIRSMRPLLLLWLLSLLMVLPSCAFLSKEGRVSQEGKESRESQDKGLNQNHTNPSRDSSAPLPLSQCRFLKKNLLKLLDKSTRIRLVLFYTQPSTKE